ncbi:MAG: class I SAM-dependent methyltransferase [Nitrospirales bacterium]
MKAVVPEDIEAYAEAHSATESAICRALREETYRTMALARMVVGPLEGAFLKCMVQAVRASRVLEIGMFTGYSAISMAEVLPEHGRVITCEIDAESAALAQKYIAQSPHGRKIEIRMGPALDTLGELTGPFELIFIDADKVNYVNYYRRAMDLVAPTGAILIDNVLWNGDVLLEPPPDDSTRAIQELNRVVASDPRVTAVLLTIRDGVLLVTPKQAPG